MISSVNLILFILEKYRTTAEHRNLIAEREKIMKNNRFLTIDYRCASSKLVQPKVSRQRWGGEEEKKKCQFLAQSNPP
jgi:hypothetical protein